MAKDEVAEALSKAEGKKAKPKKLDEVPTDTKAKKLDAKIKKALEEAFPKAKLNKVMVHTGKGATEACKAMGAKAFVTGENMFFAKPGYAKDNKLIAHELAHVIQQGNGKLPKAQKGKAFSSK